jgi:hypothetical protein
MFKELKCYLFSLFSGIFVQKGKDVKRFVAGDEVPFIRIRGGLCMHLTKKRLFPIVRR